MQTKPWYTSIGLWTNAIIMAIAILSALLEPDIVKMLTPEAAATITAAIAVLNIGLRLIAGEPITQVGANRAAKSTTRKEL